MSTQDKYPTDLTDPQWEILQPLLPPPKWRRGGTGSTALFETSGHQRDSLCDQDRLSVAYVAAQLRSLEDRLWLL